MFTFISIYIHLLTYCCWFLLEKEDWLKPSKLEDLLYCKKNHQEM